MEDQLEKNIKPIEKESFPTEPSESLDKKVSTRVKEQESLPVYSVSESEKTASNLDINSRMEKKLWRMGEVLAQEHQFSQMLVKVGRKLEQPEDCQIVALDSASAEAFYSNRDNLVVFSRGLAKKLISQGVELKEDHIAAIISHELEHEETNKRLNPGFAFDLSYKKKMRMQSEEMRADTEGMENMARAGYNPEAMIDVYKAIGLTSGRYGTSHPETIDRIRHLETRLTDDEHPIPSVGKEMTDVDEDLIKYFTDETQVYQESERLCSLSANQLQEEILDTEFQEEFWALYPMERHARRVEYGKALAGGNRDLQRLVKKQLLFRLLSTRSSGHGGRETCRLFIDGELQPEMEGELIKELREESAFITRSVKNSHLAYIFDMETGSSHFLRAMDYRGNLPEADVEDPVKASFQERIEKAEAALDEILSRQFEILEKKLADGELPDYYKAHLERIKQELNSTAVIPSADVMASAFDFLDRRVVEDNLRKGNELRRKRGLRLQGPNKSDTVDFNDLAERQHVFNAACLSTAIFMLEEIPENQITWAHLNEVLENSTELSEIEIELIAEYIFHQNEQEWVKYLGSVDRKYLPDLQKKLRAVKDEGEIRLSPRKLGAGQRISLSKCDRIDSIKNELHYKYGYLPHPFSDERGKRNALRVLRAMPAWEMYKRSCPLKNQDVFNNHYWDGVGISMDADEFEFIYYTLQRDGSDVSNLKVKYQIWSGVLRKGIDRLKQGEPLSEGELQIISSINNFTTNGLRDYGIPYRISFEEMDLLYENIPWVEGERAVKVLDWIEQEFRYEPKVKELTPEQQKRFEKMLFEIYENYPELEESFIEGRYVPYREHRAKDMIAGFLLNLKLHEIGFPREYPEVEISREDEEEVINVLNELGEKGIRISNLACINSPVQLFFEQGSEENLLRLANDFADKSVIENEKLSFSEALRLASVTPERNERYKKKDLLAGFSIYPETIDEIFKDRGYAEGIDWVLNNFHSSSIRDLLLAGLAEQMTESQKEIVGFVLPHSFSAEAVNAGRGKNAFDYQGYNSAKRLNSKGKYQELVDFFQGKGRLKEIFPDILARRYSYGSQAKPVDSESELPRFISSDFEARRRAIKGNPAQRYFGKELLKKEDRLFDLGVDLDKRIGLLTETAPHHSPVRDTYVEFMLKDSFSEAETAEKRYEAACILMPLFSEGCQFKDPYNLQMLRDEISLTADFYADPEAALQVVLNYLPESGLARNYFLDQIEERSSLTPDQIEKIISLRITEEGQSKGEKGYEAGPGPFVMNLLAEQNREEKCKTVLWLLQASEKKPLAVEKTEQNQDGSLDSFKNMFTQLTPPEREVLLRRLFLGAEGILDLEAVSDEYLGEAEKLRDNFLKSLSDHFISGETQSEQVFRSIFKTVFQKAEPAKAAHMMNNIINISLEHIRTGESFTTAELVASFLSQMGVVGKKVAQSLSEMEWVPENYKKELHRSQEEAESLPKRALYVFAEAEGLLEEDADMQIVSFDKLLGAASNKQACLLTVKVDTQEKAETLGVEVGQTTQVVGKFKRPSAQKETNIEHDLELLTEVVETIRSYGQDISLPPGFSDQIGMAVKQELDFKREEKFAQKLRNDIQRRNKYKGYTVGIPQILFSSQDLVLETRASGISVREFIDQKILGLGSVNAVILREFLAEILLSGNIQADGHPGNIFVNAENKKITMIDLGMHTGLESEKIIYAREILIGIALGKKSIVHRALRKFDWDIPKQALDFKPVSFLENSRLLLAASKQAQTPPPHDLGMVIFALSKLSPYFKGVSPKEIFTIIKESIPPSQWRLHAEIIGIEEGVSGLEKIRNKI